MRADLLPEFCVVPGGTFLMGTPEADLIDLARRYGGMRESYREEAPQHHVTLPPFALARVPVTNALYAAYVAAAHAPPPLAWRAAQPPAERAAHPVVDVSWEDASAFCNWLNTQPAARPVVYNQPDVTLPPGRFRLPSEAEWEYAARGVDARLFPWGDTFDPACANTRESGMTTSPVGAFPAGVAPFGHLDMAGNVWEWTASLDRPYPYQPADGREALRSAERRILRGGCYANPQGFARCACRFRLPPGVRSEFLGLRLAYS